MYICREMNVSVVPVLLGMQMFMVGCPVQIGGSRVDSCPTLLGHPFMQSPSCCCYIHICMYAYIYIYKYIFVHLDIHIYIYIFAYIYIYMFTYMCMDT